MFSKLQKKLKYLISILISKYKVAADEMDIDLGYVLLLFFIYLFFLGYVLEIAFSILMN